MRVVDKSDLALALKGASDTLRNLFLSNMSERAAKILRDDMAAMGPVRLRDVDAAQTRMVSLAKDLAAKGEIILSDGKADDELIY
jgi:flagellar motor switch protein FliG